MWGGSGSWWGGEGGSTPIDAVYFSFSFRSFSDSFLECQKVEHLLVYFLKMFVHQGKDRV